MKYYVSDDDIQLVENKIFYPTKCNDPILPLKDILSLDDFLHAASSIDICIEYIANRLGIKRSIKFCITRGKFPNAKAYDSQSLPFALVVLNRPFVKAVIKVAMRINCSDAIMMPIMIAEGNLEKISYHIGEVIRRPYGLMDFFEFPICPANKNSAINAHHHSAIAVMIIAFHELGHIINGHLSSGIYGSGCSGIIDESFKDSDEDIRITRKCLEMDADCFSMQWVFNFLFDNIAVFPFTDNLYTEAEVLHRIIISYLIVQLIYQIPEFSKENIYLGRDHPAAAFRLYDTFDFLALYIHRTKLKHKDNFQFNYRKLINAAWEVFEGALAEWGVEPINKAQMEEAAKNLSQYRELSLMRWAEIRSGLVEHKYGDHDLAPAQY